MGVAMGIRKEHELYERRKGRNGALLAVLFGFVVLLFAVTIVKLGTNAVNPSAQVSWGESLQNWVRGE